MEEIMGDGFVGMLAIDVEQIDRSFGELTGRLIESHAKEVGKRRIMLPIPRIEFVIDSLVIKAGVFIASPGIHGVASCRNAVFLDSLAEATVRFTVMRSQFDQKPRSQGRNEIRSKWKMAGPVPDAARSISQGGDGAGIPVQSGRVVKNEMRL